MARSTPRDAVDDHVARWAPLLPGMDPEVEGAITRVQHIVRHQRRLQAAANAGSESSLEDRDTLHTLMVQPYPVEATPAQLAEACHVTRAAMTSRLDRLVEARWVTREVDPSDRRRIIVRPTPDGRTAWDTHLVEGMGREATLFHPLSHAELVQLNTLLRKVLVALEE